MLTIETANERVQRPITHSDIWHRRSNVHLVAGHTSKADNPLLYERKHGLKRWLGQVMRRAPADDGATFVCNLNPNHKNANAKAVELQKLNGSVAFQEE